MEANVRISCWLRAYWYGGRGGVTNFSDRFATISRRVYELEAFLRSGVCAAGSSVARLYAAGGTEFNDGRHRRRSDRPERRDSSGRQGRVERRDQGKHARVRDEQGRRVPLLFAVAWTVHGNGDRDGISDVQPPCERGGWPNRNR